MSFRCGIASTLLGLSGLLVAPASADDAARLEGLLAAMTSYKATFQQTVTNSYGETLQTSAGKMSLLRPNRLRWQVDEPYPQLVLADGTSLWIHDPDLQQVTVTPLTEAIEGTPAVFLTSASGTLTTDFLVRAVAAPTAEASAFVLEPTAAGAAFRDATVTFDGSGLLTSLELIDHLGQTTHIVFAAAELNPVLESTAFAFEIPLGIDVIGNVPAPTEHGAGEPAAN